MRTLRSWSVLAIGLLAAACGTGANAPEARTGDTDPQPTPDGNAQPSAFPGETSRAPAGDDGSADAQSAPAAEATPSPASPPSGTAGARAPSADKKSAEASKDAPRARGESRSSRRPLDVEAERPGLGTNWGETRTSHVTNAPFERASGNPFALTTIRYNDHSGIAAMTRGATLVDFRADSAPAAGGTLTVRLLDANGAPLPTFINAGRNLVAGEHGQRYVIEISNRSPRRFEAVVAVDGLDVVDGQTGSFSKRGYLIHPFATVEIDGFRQNMDEVAAFRFGSVRNSYASRKGSDRNVGVIGVAFFAERGAEAWTQRELVRREGADPFPGRFASPPIAR
jgi:hypothetical protein